MPPRVTSPFGSMGSFTYAARQPELPMDQRAVASLQELPPELLRGFVEPGTAEWMEFARTAHVLRRKIDDGPMVVSISRLPSAGGLGKAKGKSWMPSHFDKSAEGNFDKPGSRTFELAQFFSDRDIIEKFALSSAQINRYRAMASVDILAAARGLQGIVRRHQGYESARVSSSKYASSWKAARESLMAHAARFPLITVTTEAMFVGEKIFIYSTTNRDAWSVRGSERVAALVRAVHRMVEASSPETVIFAMGPELTLLDIDIIVAGSVLSPCREQHMGPHSDLPINTSSSFLDKITPTDKRRLAALVSAIESVEIDGEPMGSAVRVSKNHAITCEHLVTASGRLSVSGAAASSLRPVSRDMWFLEIPGADVNWPLRSPVLDEMVVLCYRRYDALNWFGPLRVLSSDRTQLTYTKIPGLTGGMSGAAIISVNDFSMLGIHEGTTLAHAIGSVYSPRMHTELWRVEPSLFPTEVIPSEQPYVQFKKRGLKTAIDATYDCLEPAYLAGVHCGSFLRVADLCIFPDRLTSTVVESTDQSCVTGTSSLKYARVGDPQKHFLRPPLIREPIHDELVAVIARDSEGDYSSDRLCLLTEYNVRTGTFEVLLEGGEIVGTSFYGGVVIAAADGAVVGMVNAIAKANDATAVRCICEVINIAMVSESVTSVASREVATSLPFVRFKSWPALVQDAVMKLVTTAEVGEDIRHALGLGRMIALSRFNVALDRKGFPPTGRVPIIQDFFSGNKVFQRMTGTRRENFRMLMHIDDELSPDIVASKLAEVMHTLIGLCMIYDKPEAVDRMVEFFYHDL